MLPDLDSAGDLRSEIAYANSLVARYSVLCGRHERADEVMAPCAQDGFRSIPRNLFWLATIANLAHACAALGDRQQMALLEQVIEPVEHLMGIVCGPVLYAGSLAAGRAALLEALGRQTEAAQAWERAVAAEAKIGAAYYERVARERRDRQ